tara:strand:+ start:2712 stop:2975 length:264 start_codon:yes stop_codon:yes gene_type:complete
MTMETVDPLDYNLPTRTKLLKDGSGSLFIVIDRKSRVVMKDGNRVLNIAKRIKEVNQNTNISLLTSAPVCSKTKEFLLKHNVSVLAI